MSYGSPAENISTPPWRIGDDLRSRVVEEVPQDVSLCEAMHRLGVSRQSGRVSRAAGSKLSMSGADARKACASSSIATTRPLQPSLINKGCSMKQQFKYLTNQRQPRRHIPGRRPVNFLDAIDPAAAGPIAISCAFTVRLFQHRLGSGRSRPNRSSATRPIDTSLGGFLPPLVIRLG
jgi:hypothetical protein